MAEFRFWLNKDVTGLLYDPIFLKRLYDIIQDGTIENIKKAAIVPVLGTSNLVRNEVLTGVINGSNVLFTTRYPFIPESVEVFIGVRLNLIDDFITVGINQVQLTASPLPPEVITANYTRQ